MTVRDVSFSGACARLLRLCRVGGMPQPASERASRGPIFIHPLLLATIELA